MNEDENPFKFLFEEDKEEQIKEKIVDVLRNKMSHCNYWHETKIMLAKNIIEGHMIVAAEYAYKKAEYNVYGNRKDDNYFEDLEKKAIEIAKNELEINPEFDIDRAIIREEEIKRREEAGIITKEEALVEYKKPIDGRGLQNLRGYKSDSYEIMYNEIQEETKANTGHKREKRDMMDRDI